MSLHVVPLLMAWMQLRLTPNILPSSAKDFVYPTDFMYPTDSADSLVHSGVRTRTPRSTMGTPLASPNVHRWPFRILLIVCCLTPKSLAISCCGTLREAPAKRIPATCSAVNLVLPPRDTAPHSLPRTDEYTMFPWWVTHSRLLTQLLATLKSLWLASVSSAVGSLKCAISTSLCTKNPFPHRRPGPSDFRWSVIRLYPFLSVRCFRTLPGSTYGLCAVRFKRSADLTLPRLLTSYKPSYPTTGSHFSSSILNLSSGLKPSLRLLTNLFVTVSSSIPRGLYESVRRLQRLVSMPAPGAFPVLGLGCRS